MRNDYAAYGLLKDRVKYIKEILDYRISPTMGPEEKTLIRIQVHMMSYKEVVVELMKVRASKNQS